RAASSTIAVATPTLSKRITPETPPCAYPLPAPRMPRFALHPYAHPATVYARPDGSSRLIGPLAERLGAAMALANFAVPDPGGSGFSGGAILSEPEVAASAASGADKFAEQDLE